MFGTTTNLTISTEGTLRTDGTGSVHSVENAGESSLWRSRKSDDFEVDWKISGGKLTMTPQQSHVQPKLQDLLRDPSSIVGRIKHSAESKPDIDTYEVKSISGLVSTHTAAAKEENLGTEKSLGALTWTIE